MKTRVTFLFNETKIAAGGGKFIAGGEFIVYSLFLQRWHNGVLGNPSGNEIRA